MELLQVVNSSPRGNAPRTDAIDVISKHHIPKNTPPQTPPHVARHDVAVFQSHSKCIPKAPDVASASLNPRKSEPNRFHNTSTMPAQTLYPRATVKKIVKAHANRPLSKTVDILVCITLPRTPEGRERRKERQWLMWL